ncbi:Dimethylaniline monooxygenase [N-oxide-forming] 5, partial [Tauraco erythrolophus]
CLDEGLVPTCFERSGDIGGLWRFEVSPALYQPARRQNHRRSWDRLLAANHAPLPCFACVKQAGFQEKPQERKSAAAAGGPHGASWVPDTCSPRTQTSVCRVAKCPDFTTTGRWEVVTESKGKQEAAIFDAVLVCTGHHTDAHLPLSTFPGLEKFEGWYLHSRDYKSPQSFLGKRVVVVGTGNSGIDIAVELSHTAKQVFLSTKRGTWVLHRVADGGYPFDFSYISRFVQLLHNLLPQNASNFLLERKVNSRFDHALYGLQPQHRILDQHPTINDDLPNRIISGRVLVKPNVQEFMETSAVFEDGTREDIDAVVFATGYSFSFPFLEGCVKVVENQIPLYKFMFPANLEKPTLATTAPPAATTSSSPGLQDLPPSSAMLADIAQTKEKMAERYVKSRRHTIQVDYIPLALEVAFGPCTPYQYRLRGPGKWVGAREAILTQRQRVVR